LQLFLLFPVICCSSPLSKQSCAVWHRIVSFMLQIYTIT